MKNRQKRFMLILGGLAALGIAAALMLNAFNKNMVFFFSPSQVYANEAPKERAFRLGGLVEKGSLKREDDGLTVHFVVTDTIRKMDVTYKGILPDLFREGKGVIAQGHLDASGMFQADDVLAKHDENYMPPEAARAIEKAQAAAVKGGQPAIIEGGRK